MTRSRFALALLAGCLVFGLVQADTLMTKKVHQDAFSVMGQNQPAKDSTATIWLAKDRLRQDGGDGSMLLRADLKKMYIIDHSAKKYSALNLPVDFKKLFPPEMAAMADQMLQMMKMEATVTPTAETRTIRAWNCKRYNVTVKMAMGETKMTLWASPDVKFEFPATELFDTMKYALTPGMEAMAKEFKKIDGYPVLTETVAQMMGAEVKSTEELVSVETKAAPAGTWDVPAGYTEEPFDFTKMGQNK